MNKYKEYLFSIGDETSGENSPDSQNMEVSEDLLSSLYSTSGSTGPAAPTINLSISEKIESLSEQFHNLKSSDQKSLLFSLIQSINKILNRYYAQNYEISHLPPLHVLVADDDSLLIEWIYKDFRIGFSLELVVKDSSWYLISNNNLENITSSGLIDPSNLDVLIDELVIFVFQNT